MSEPRSPVEDLAAALQRCFDHAADKAVNELVPRLDRMDGRLDRMDGRLDRMDGRLDKQDETLRLMWKQMKGNGKLPIDA